MIKHMDSTQYKFFPTRFYQLTGLSAHQQHLKYLSSFHVFYYIPILLLSMILRILNVDALSSLALFHRAF